MIINCPSYLSNISGDVCVTNFFITTSLATSPWTSVFVLLGNFFLILLFLFAINWRDKL